MSHIKTQYHFNTSDNGISALMHKKRERNIAKYLYVTELDSFRCRFDDHPFKS